MIRAMRGAGTLEHRAVTRALQFMLTNFARTRHAPAKVQGTSFVRRA